MAYEVIWHEGALKDLKKLDKQVAKNIISKVKNYLVLEPLKLGKPLKGNYVGLYRYRFGNYRVIYNIDKGESQIQILTIGHRKKVYKGKD